MAASTLQRDERIDLRISSDQKTLLARAASYAGVSLSNFLVSAAADRAKELVAERETLTLTPRDWSKFLGALDKTERPRPKLEAAARRYRKRRA